MSLKRPHSTMAGFNPQALHECDRFWHSVARQPARTINICKVGQASIGLRCQGLSQVRCPWLQESNNTEPQVLPQARCCGSIQSSMRCHYVPQLGHIVFSSSSHPGSGAPDGLERFPAHALTPAGPRSFLWVVFCCLCHVSVSIPCNRYKDLPLQTKP